MSEQNNATNHYLLVDDDAVFCRVLAKALAQRGINCVTANNSASAMQALLSNHGQFTRAIIDLNLGNESGLNVLTQLLERAPDLKIIVLTGYSSIATAVEAVKRGACNYLCKPASAQSIIDAFEPDSSNTNAELLQEKPSAERLQWEYIQKTLAENNGNISATARALGMHRRTLQRKLQKRPVNQ